MRACMFYRRVVVERLLLKNRFETAPLGYYLIEVGKMLGGGLLSAYKKDPNKVLEFELLQIHKNRYSSRPKYGQKL